MFKLLSWILNVDFVQWPGMMLVCETRWLEREGDISVITPLRACLEGCWFGWVVILSEKKNGKFLVVVFVSERERKSILFFFM